MGRCPVRRDDGRRDRRRRLAYYPHTRTQDGQDATVHGFAAETTAAVIIQVASSYGIPLSTTHVISTSIMGVGAVKRFSGVKWTLVERIVWTWVLTFPSTALMGYILARAAAAF